MSPKSRHGQLDAVAQRPAQRRRAGDREQRADLHGLVRAERVEPRLGPSATGEVVQVILLILRLAAPSVGWLAETGSRSEHAPRVKAQVKEKTEWIAWDLLYRVGQMPWLMVARLTERTDKLFISFWIDTQKFAGRVVRLRGRAGIGIVDYRSSGR